MVCCIPGWPISSHEAENNKHFIIHSEILKFKPWLDFGLLTIKNENAAPSVSAEWP